MKAFSLRLVLTLCILGSLAAPAPARSVEEPTSQEQGQLAQKVAPRPTLVLQGNRLSVRMHNVPWETVVEELERQTGILTRLDGRPAGTLTQEFEALPLEQGLRRLFRSANLLFFYAAAQGRLEAKLTRIWLFPKEGGTGEEQPIRAFAIGAADKNRGEVSAMAEARQATPPEEVESVAGEYNPEERLTRLQALAQQDNVEALQQAFSDPDPTIQATALELLAERAHPQAIALLLGATKSAEPERRFQALNLLHQTSYADTTTILSALDEALADEDANVRSYAVQALAARGGPEALAPLRQVLRDPDSSVRMMLIQNVVPEDQGLLLLREALSDVDETLRSEAALRLEQAVSEASAH